MSSAASLLAMIRPAASCASGSAAFGLEDQRELVCPLRVSARFPLVPGDCVRRHARAHGQPLAERHRQRRRHRRDRRYRPLAAPAPHPLREHPLPPRPRCAHARAGRGRFGTHAQPPPPVAARSPPLTMLIRHAHSLDCPAYYQPPPHIHHTPHAPPTPLPPFHPPPSPHPPPHQISPPPPPSLSSGQRRCGGPWLALAGSGLSPSS